MLGRVIVALQGGGGAQVSAPSLVAPLGGSLLRCGSKGGLGVMTVRTTTTVVAPPLVAGPPPGRCFSQASPLSTSPLCLVQGQGLRGVVLGRGAARALHPQRHYCTTNAAAPSSSSMVLPKSERPDVRLSSGPGLIVYSKMYIPPDYGQGSNRPAYYLLVFPLIFFGLGTWQVYRYFWKQDVVKAVKARVLQPPTELPSNIPPEDIKDKRYTPYFVSGEFVHEEEILLGPRCQVLHNSVNALETGKVGFHVITPLKRDDGTKVLVSRGWIPQELASQSLRPETVVKGKRVKVSGLLQITERGSIFVPDNEPERGRWYWKDLDAMAARTGSLPLLIELDDSANGKGEPTYPVGGQTRVVIKDDHLHYLLTWYSLSLATAYMTYRSWSTKYGVSRGFMKK